MSSGFDRAQWAYDSMLPPDRCDECRLWLDDHCECGECDCACLEREDEDCEV